MYKKCQIVILSTNEKTNISLGNSGKGMIYHGYVNIRPDYDKRTYQHLYILSDEEIKKDDWYLAGNSITQCSSKEEAGDLTNACKKITATTDSSLNINTQCETYKKEHCGGYCCGLPQIPQQFIEHFVSEYNKGNIITEVMVEYEESEKTFERSSGFAGYKCTSCCKWQYEGVSNYCCLKLKINSKDNTINIKPVKESWNRDEVAELLFKALTEGAKMNMFEGAFRPKDYFEKEFKEWIEDNL